MRKAKSRKYRDATVDTVAGDSERLTAPLSKRERTIYGLALLALIGLALAPRVTANTGEVGKLFSLAPKVCSAEANWANPHLSVGQVSISFDGHISQIDSSNSATTNGGTGSLLCYGFTESTDHHRINNALHIAIKVTPDATDPNNPDETTQATSTSATAPLLSEPETAPIETEMRPEIIEPNIYGVPRTSGSLDSLLMLEVSEDNGTTWLPYHEITSAIMTQESAFVSVALDEEIVRDLANFAVRLVPTNENHGTKVSVDGFSFSYEVGESMNVSTSLIDDTDTNLTGAKPLVSPGSEVRVGLEVKSPEDGLWQGLTGKIMSNDTIDTGAISAVAELLDSDNNVIAKEAGTINWLGAQLNGSTRGVASFDIIPSSLDPGTYAIKIAVTDSFGATSTSTQDFLWGVLALNTDKTIYANGEQADVSMTVLDENGATICDAQIRLVVSSPSGKESVFTTNDNSIRKGPLCEIYSAHNDPDYSANVTFHEIGKYAFSLTATTANGTYTIADTVEVEDNPVFSVRRSAPTRIYPIESYAMEIEISSDSAFSGTVSELVPSEFVVSPTSESDSFTRTKVDNGTQLNWYVSLGENETTTLAYTFDAPDIAPEFYLVGPATLTDDSGVEVFKEIRQWQIASDALEVTIDATILDATDEFAASPSVVFTDAQTGYVFYIDATSQDLAYSKTITGGASWGAATVINTARNWTAVSVWYDQWTPGDETGRLIHIASVEDSTDDTYYTYLDTSTDTLNATPVIANTATVFTEAADGPPTITKNSENNLFIATNFTTTAGGIVSKSTTAGVSWTPITPAGWSTVAIDQVQLVPLLTDDDILAIRVNTTGNTIESRVYDEVTDTWDGSWTSIGTLTESTTYDQWFSASTNKANGTVYLSYGNAPSVAGNDIEFRTYSDSTRTWTARTNLFTDNATVVAPSVIHDESSSTLTVAYVRGTLNANTSIYYKTSTDEGVTWSAESSRLNTVIDDMKNVRSNYSGANKTYFVWYNDDLDDLVGNVVTNNITQTEVAIDATITDATDEFGPSPSVVFTDSQTGYIFFIDDVTTRDWAYRKTTDGGTTWGNAVVINTARNWVNTSVWYDQWTPGDDTGTLIHVAASESGTDDTYYTYLDTATDTLRTGQVLVHAATAITEAADGPPTITKNGQDYLFIETNHTTAAGGIVSKSINGGTTWAPITPAGWSTVAIDQMQLVPLLTNDDVMAIRVNTAGNNIQYRIYAEATDTWAGAWTTIGTLTESTTYDQWFSASILKSTGDVYLSYNNQPANAAGDLEFRTFSDTTRTWTARTNIFTNNATVIAPSVMIDQATGNVYVSYVRGTLNTNTNIYYVSSTNSGVTWSVESNQLNEVTDDMKNVRSNMMSDQRLYTVWYNDDLDDVLGTTVATFDASLEQSSYRFFTNNNATTVGAALAAQDTTAQLADSGQAFRVRMLLTNASREIAVSGEEYRLQYAARGGGSCSAPSGGIPAVYTNVTNSTRIAYYNNASPTDGDVLTPDANDPTDSPNTVVAQTYEESNDFTNSQSVIQVGDAALWDFALYDNAAPNSTDYCFRIVRSDGSLIETYTNYPMITTSDNVAPNAPTALAQRRTDDTAIATNGWTNETSIELTASSSDTNNPDSLALCVEVDPIGTSFSNTNDSCSSLNAYSGSPITVVHTATGLTHNTQYHWQARLRDEDGLYSAWVSYGANLESARDFAVDTANPTGNVYDGAGIGVDVDYNNGSLNSLSANWSMSDPHSGISGYEYSIGTSPGATDISNWTSTALVASATANSLTLRTSAPYYTNVRTSDVAGNQSVISADGIFVAPTLSFSTTPATISFGTLNSGNSYTATDTTTLTTSTNAYNGYTVRAYAQSLLATDTSTINMFNGGTYASPDGWLGSDRGYGYTSSDTLVNGINRFNPVTCAGGNASPCYAPFSTIAPGDIIADNTSLISGNPIVGEQFTITHRVTTESTQDAGAYRTVIVYSVVARY